MLHHLIDREQSCLLVIDIQHYFLDKLPPEAAERVVARAGWLMRVARLLDIPIIATAEDIAKNGPLHPQLASLLPGGAAVHDKMVFGLCGQLPIFDEVRKTGRTEFVFAGLETDVCIAHSALGLMQNGFRAAIVEDATASPPPAHDYGIRRLAAAGAIVTSVKGIYFEWVRDLATHQRIRAELNVPLPAGLTL